MTPGKLINSLAHKADLANLSHSIDPSNDGIIVKLSQNSDEIFSGYLQEALVFLDKRLETNTLKDTKAMQATELTQLELLTGLIQGKRYYHTTEEYSIYMLDGILYGSCENTAFNLRKLKLDPMSDWVEQKPYITVNGLQVPKPLTEEDNLVDGEALYVAMVPIEHKDNLALLQWDSALSSCMDYLADGLLYRNREDAFSLSCALRRSINVSKVVYK